MSSQAEKFLSAHKLNPKTEVLVIFNLDVSQCV